MFNWRNFLYDPNELAGGATPPVVEPVVTTPPPAAAPWAADAATYFGDNAEATAAFDRYMREKQQPYITQLEESSAPARELWTDLNDEAKVETAARDIIASVYANNPEVIAAYDAIFAEEVAPVVTPPATTPDEIPEWAKPLVEDRQTKLDREAAETEAANYKTFKEGLKTSHGLTDNDLVAIDPFIFRSPDNADVAVAAYKDWLQASGFTPAAAPVVPTPPPILGADGTSATPPLATQYTKYGQMGDAIKGFLAREGASATPPPVVG